MSTTETVSASVEPTTETQLVIEGQVRATGEPANPLSLFSPPPLVDKELLEHSTLEYWISDTDPHAKEWTEYGTLSGKAEGETLDKFRAYIESAYLLRKLEIIAVNEEGDHFSRERFITKASNVQMANGVSSADSGEGGINLKLTAYGLVSLLRSTIVSDNGSAEPIRSTPSDPPGDEFYGGNLNKSTLVAMSTLMKSTSKSKNSTGVTTYHWKGQQEEKLAKDIVAGLRSCTIPKNADRVRNIISEYRKAQEQYQRDRLKRIDPDRYEESERRRLYEEREAKRSREISKILTATATLLDGKEGEPLLTMSSLRTKLEEAGQIPKIEVKDVKPLLAGASSRKPVMQALVEQGLTPDDVLTLLGHPSTFQVLLETLAETMSEKDATEFGKMLVARYKTDPTAAKVAVGLKTALAPILRAVNNAVQQGTGNNGVAPLRKHA